MMPVYFSYVLFFILLPFVTIQLLKKFYTRKEIDIHKTVIPRMGENQINILQTKNESIRKQLENINKSQNELLERNDHVINQLELIKRSRNNTNLSLNTDG